MKMLSTNQWLAVAGPEFVEKTEVGKRPGAENDKVDLWDVERLDKTDGEGEGAVENGEE
jgi:ribosomal protein S3AE